MKLFKSVPNFVLLAALLLGAGIAVPSLPVYASDGASYLVNTNADNDVDDGFCSLREAILAAISNLNNYRGCENANPGTFGNDYIQFSLASTDRTITLGSTLPQIFSDSITINGYNNGSPVIIDGANSVRILYVSNGTTLTIGNLTLQNGNSGGEIGGAIRNDGILIVLKSAFLDNHNTSDGGAIANLNGSAAIIGNSTFSGNSASYGGALSNNSGTMSVYNSTFSGNTASTQGGALSVWFGGDLPPATSVYNSILANSNTAEDCWNGGGGTLTGSNNIIEITTEDSTSCSAIAASTSDPMLGALTGSPPYFPLPSTSPAFNTGDNTICAGPPVNNESQNSASRPQGGICDIGAFEYPHETMVIKSSGAQDGWILESSETSGKGKKLNSGNPTLNIGDDKANRQYRAILSFDTSSLPDDAIITSVTLQFKYAGKKGTLPFKTHGKLLADILMGPFSGDPALQKGDFKSPASRNGALAFTKNKVDNWYIQSLSAADFQYINFDGLTQFRLRFKKDDNNDFGADFLKIFSGDAAEADRPQLIVEYYVP
jgi:CSLREA domain-containing protein